MTVYLRTGALMQIAGITRSTLRYYERRGLLTAYERGRGGHRVYTLAAAKRVQTIRSAQRLGFSLEEVAQLLEAPDADSEAAAGLASVRERTTSRLRDIDARITDLHVLRAGLLESLETVTTNLRSESRPFREGDA